MPIFDHGSIFQETIPQKSQQEVSNNIFVIEEDVKSIFEEQIKEAEKALSLFKEDVFETEDDEFWEEDDYEDEDIVDEDALSEIFEAVSNVIEPSIFQKSNSSIFETTCAHTPKGIFVVGCTKDKCDKELSDKLIEKDNVIDTLEAIKTILELI